MKCGIYCIHHHRRRRRRRRYQCIRTNVKNRRKKKTTIKQSFLFSWKLEWNRMEFLFAIFHLMSSASSTKHQFIHIRMVLRYENLKYFFVLLHFFIDIWIVIISCIAHSASIQYTIFIVVWINDLWIDTSIDKSVRRFHVIPFLLHKYLIITWIEFKCPRKEYYLYLAIRSDGLKRVTTPYRKIELKKNWVGLMIGLN